MKTRGYRAQFKAKGEAGEFTGYAAVFGNVDDGLDVIEPGAFKKFDLMQDGRVRVLYEHRTIVGAAKVEQDEKGLRVVEGELFLEKTIAQDVYKDMKRGAVDAMSFGYRVLPGGKRYAGDVRFLSALECFEISLLPFPMNDLARIDAVKGAGLTIRELEEALRDGRPLSHSMAKEIAECWFKARGTARDELDVDALASMLSAANPFNHQSENKK